MDKYQTQLGKDKLPVSATRWQFYQHFMSSFCAKFLSPKNYKPKL